MDQCLSETTADSVLARRDFLKTTGVVVVGFSIADRVAAQAPGDGAPARPAWPGFGSARSRTGRFLHRDPC